MNVKPFLRSFAAGVIGPELFGRLDLIKYQTGLAEALNFWVLPHGPAQNRPGFAYVLEVKDSTKATRVIPFSYSSTQTIIIELGDLYARFHTQGGTLLETAKTITAITKANPGVATSAAHGFTNGQWVYLAGIVGMTELNGRYVKVAGVTANTFQITDIHGGGNIDTTSFTTYTSGGTASRVYEITTPYNAADLFDLHFVQSADVLTIVHPSYAPRELRRLSATLWSLTSISFVPTIATPAAPTVTASGGGAESNTYKVTALAAETLEESLASSATSVTGVTLSTSGAFNTITPPAVSGAVRYNIYKLSSGLYGYIGQTDGTAFRDNNITADISQTPPELSNPFATPGNYPGAVGYYEQRRCFGGTDNKPQNFWATRTATENNLSYSIPTRDDDAIAFRIAAREVNRIRHIVSLDQLLFLTSGGEWKVAPQNSDVLTPATAGPKQFGAEGANNVQPAITSSSVIYVQESGNRMREMKYQWEANGYQVSDISILAPHLFDDYQITDLAYVKTPYKFIWCVRSDGRLLSLTYLPEQQVLAWCQHDTQGFFESVAAVKEGDEHALYAVVRRTINGRSVRYIERLHSRRFTNAEDAFFVDSGATYDGAPTTTIRNGLWHLEGQEVAVLADAAEVTGVTVTNGAIALDYDASVVHIGLRITADLQTLPVSVEVQALGQGLEKNVNEVHLRLKDTSGIKIGPTFEDSDLVEITRRSGENYGSAPALITGVETVTLSPEWGDDAQVCIRQDAPLPCTLLAMVLEVPLGG